MMQIKHNSSLIYTALLILLSLVIYSHNQQDIESFRAVKIIKLTATEAEEENLDTDEEHLDNEDKNILASESLTKALALSKQNKTASAIFLYQSMLDDNPNHQIAATNLALLKKREQGCLQAEPAIRHAIAVTRGQRLAKALSLQGSCFIENQRYNDAIKSITRAIEFRPNHALLWKKLAHVQNLSKHAIDVVITTYQRALALDQKDLKLRLLLANLQYQHLDFNGSIGTLREDYSSIKTSFQGQILLAWNYLEVRKFNNAKKHIKIARRLDNSKIDILEAMQRYANKQFNSSINYIKNLKSKSPSFQYLLALNYRAKNWPKSANKYLKKLSTSKNHQLLSQLNTALITNENNKVEKTLLHFKNLIKARTLTPYIGYKGAYIAFNNNHISDAKIWLETYSIPSDDLKTNLLYCDVLWQLDLKDFALQLLHDLHQSAQKNALIIRKYAARLHENDRNTLAEKVINNLVLSDYKSEDFFLDINILLALKQTEKALLRLFEAIDYWPNNTQLRLLLAKTLLLNNQREKSKQQINFLLKLDSKHQPALTFIQENFNE
jgi:predicted Zn-dependent protease